MEISVVIIGVVTAAFAWLFQKAWDRQQIKLERYQEILDRVPALAEGSVDLEKIDEIYKEFRRLWLYAPDKVVRACLDFIWATNGTATPADERNSALGRLVIEMRNDMSFRNFIIPSFNRTKLSASEFIIARANKKPQGSKV